jgi:NCAIR mutase (PurE)-related protein
MNPEHLRHLIESHGRGEISMEDVISRLSSISFENLGYANVDHHRRTRKGYPEVIYGEGKTPEQTTEIFRRLADQNPNVLCTRVTDEIAGAILEAIPGTEHHKICRIVEIRRNREEGVGLVVVATGGTSDIPVAEESSIVLESFGSRVERLYDVGVAGIHRLLYHTDLVRKANCVIAVAGMEGALPSVVGGLVDVPVIAVPTSVGYGASFGGLAALLAMLNSCASGISVVNIDNGFGAAYQADMINKMAAGVRRKKQDQ